jgi:hypothetical protein
MGLGHVSGWMFQHWDLVLRQKCLDRQCVVCWHVVMVKNMSRSSTIQVKIVHVKSLKHFLYQC